MHTMKPFGTTERFFYFYPFHQALQAMRTIISVLSILTLTTMSQAQIPSLYLENKTPTYDETIAYFKHIDSMCDYMQMRSYGTTDAGFPLDVLVIDGDKQFTPEAARAAGKAILLINNGIHPGEPDGIDACIQLITQYAGAGDLKSALEGLVICIIPVYNIDGALNRNSTTRVNQEGPESYGFRGNGRNYDLNRDFVKCDTRNSKSFAEIFHLWDPDIFVDTHVSNGADYQYVMTLIPTQHNKLTPPLGALLKNDMLPSLYKAMEGKGFPMCPYVNEVDRIPDNGIAGFLDHGRYSTGFTALFNTIGFMPETHMLKPYPQRVASTLAFIEVVIDYIQQNRSAIIEARAVAKQTVIQADTFNLQWKLDTEQQESFMFNGYAAKFKKSDVSGLDRLWYDRNEPFTKPIPFFDTYTPTLSIVAPEAYIVPQAWLPVIERLQWNGVRMERLEKDTAISVESYYITGFDSVDRPWEGHYFHSNVKVRKVTETLNFMKGDYIIPLNQESNLYIVQVLEPQAPDAFFAWGMMDAVLQQKEWFSDYVFEDLAAEILQQDPQLRNMLNEAMIADPSLKNDAEGQLAFVFEHSKYKEPTHNRYPIARIVKK